jgi:hypothetical protein
MNYPLFGVGHAYDLEKMVADKRPDLLLYKKEDWEFEFNEQSIYAKQQGAVRARFDLTGLNSQCGVCCFSDVMRYGDTLVPLLEYGEEVAKAYGYTKIMATLVDERKIRDFIEAGFKAVDSFTNLRSGNQVHILTKELKYEDYTKRR